MPSRFEQVFLPHLSAAYNLARWLTRDDQDAEDVVQEAYLRAWRFFERFHGNDGRAWLLAIVRHVAYDWIRTRRPAETCTSFDETLHTPSGSSTTPEHLLMRRADRARLQAALEALPIGWREVVVLRELEGLSYKEIAEVAGIPLGTVMSRLARARDRLQQELLALGLKE
jgi:RNA polymerase sigma factor (sigma-70 family)